MYVNHFKIFDFISFWQVNMKKSSRVVENSNFFYYTYTHSVLMYILAHMYICAYMLVLKDTVSNRRNSNLDFSAEEQLIIKAKA